MKTLITETRSGCSWMDVTVLILGLSSVLLVLWVALSTQGSWPGYAEMVASLPHPVAWLRWILGDISEVAFYKHELASLGLLGGAYLAWWASKHGKTWQGFSISYGTGLWPWLITSSLLGLLLSNLLWGWSVTAQTWQPTFAAFVSLPAAMVLMFGGGWKVAINGAVLGALLVTPMCLLIVNFVCVPLGLPVVIGNVVGMAVGSVIAFVLCRRVPLLVRSDYIAPRQTGACKTAYLRDSLEHSAGAGRLFRSAVFWERTRQSRVAGRRVISIRPEPRQPGVWIRPGLAAAGRPGADIVVRCRDLAKTVDQTRLVPNLRSTGIRRACGCIDPWW